MTVIFFGVFAPLERLRSERVRRIENIKSSEYVVYNYFSKEEAKRDKERRLVQRDRSALLEAAKLANRVVLSNRADWCILALFLMFD